MKINKIFLLVFLVALSANIQAGVALGYDHEGFVTACLESGDLSRAVCECTSNKAARELSPTGFQFLVSTLKKEKEKSLELRSKLKQKEVATAGRFMSRGPAICAKELGEKPAGTPSR